MILKTWLAALRTTLCALKSDPPPPSSATRETSENSRLDQSWVKVFDAVSLKFSQVSVRGCSLSFPILKQENQRPSTTAENGPLILWTQLRQISPTSLVLKFRLLEESRQEKASSARGNKIWAQVKCIANVGNRCNSGRMVVVQCLRLHRWPISSIARSIASPISSIAPPAF